MENKQTGFKCCLCGKHSEGWGKNKQFGNNPSPLAKKGECCDECNSTKVIQSRIEQYQVNRMRKIKIKIIDLGREKFNGTFIFEGNKKEINKQLDNECRKHLLSNDISCDGETIFAGFRAVGRIKIAEEQHGKNN